MDKPKRAKTKELQTAGFKQIPEHPELYINESGQTVNTTTGKKLTYDKRNAVFYNGKRIRVEKMLLSAFKNEPIRENSQITHIDGNKSNLNPQNVKYTQINSKEQQTTVNPAKLKKVIRLYMQVPANFTAKDRLITRFYIKAIAEKRKFCIQYRKATGIKVFESYLNTTKTRTQIAKQQNITFRDCTIFINSFINQLITDSLKDYKAGKLIKQNYLSPRKTEKQILREWKQICNELKTATK